MVDTKEQELIKEIEEWRKGEHHWNEKKPDEESCAWKSKEFGDMLCEDCYIGFRIRESKLEGIKEGKKEQMEEELEWLEICFERFPHNFIEQRISKLKEMLK